jgi:hypothetical protein
MPVILTFEARYFGSPDEALELSCDRIAIEQKAATQEGGQRSVLPEHLVVQGIDRHALREFEPTHVEFVDPITGTRRKCTIGGIDIGSQDGTIRIVLKSG